MAANTAFAGPPSDVGRTFEPWVERTVAVYLLSAISATPAAAYIASTGWSFDHARFFLGPSAVVESALVLRSEGAGDIANIRIIPNTLWHFYPPVHT